MSGSTPRWQKESDLRKALALRLASDKVPLRKKGLMRSRRMRGFSLLELMIVLAIIMVVMGFAIPLWLTGTRTAKLRGAESDYASLLQMARMRAATDDGYYSVYIQQPAGAAAQLAYLDIYPQNANGTWGTGAPPTGSYTAGP